MKSKPSLSILWVWPGCQYCDMDCGYCKEYNGKGCDICLEPEEREWSEEDKKLMEKNYGVHPTKKPP